MKSETYRQVYLSESESQLLETLLTDSYCKLNNDIKMMTDGDIDEAKKLIDEHKLLIDKIKNPVEFIK